MFILPFKGTLPNTIDATEFVPGQYNYTVKLTDLDGQELTVEVPFTVRKLEIQYP